MCDCGHRHFIGCKYRKEDVNNRSSWCLTLTPIHKVFIRFLFEMREKWKINIYTFFLYKLFSRWNRPWDLRKRSYQIQTRLPTGFPSLFLKVSRGQRHGRVNLSRKLSPHSQDKLCLCFQDTGRYNFLFILIFIMFSMTGKLVFHFPDFPHFQVSLISQRETLRGINKVHCLSKGWFLSDSESHPSDFCFLEK